MTSSENKIPQWMQDEVAEYDLNMVPPPATILDIGANIGAFSLHYSAKWPEARITAYEPVKQNLAGLWLNVRHNPRICVVHMAVRETCGRQDIFLGDQGVTCGFHQRGRQTTRTELVQCIAADLISSAELVKIDTEGCELEILSGLNLDLTRAVVVEYHSQEDRLQIEAIMARRKFQYLQQIPGSGTHGVLKFGKDGGVSVPVKMNGSRRQSSSSALPGARKIYVAIAGHYSSYDITFVQAMCALMLRSKVSVQIGWNIDPSVERARNILTANFLESDCTHLLFIDSDIGFSAEDIARISSHAVPVVGGLYPVKSLTPEVQWCGNGLKPGSAEIREDGLSQVKYIGTGFLCIQREVFEALVAHDGPQIVYQQDFAPYRTEHAFWRQGVVDGRFLTEDWLFCDRWLKLGGKVFCDTQVVLRHAGRAEWPLPFQTGNPFVVAGVPPGAVGGVSQGAPEVVTAPKPSSVMPETPPMASGGLTA